MTATRLGVVALPFVALALAGCGSGASQGPPKLDQLPLVAGSQVVAQSIQCDKGANAFCGLELVVVNPRFRTSEDLVNAEHDVVHQAGWPGVGGDTGDERAAESPGNKLRVTYGTAYGDLQGIELGWIHRSARIARALSRTLFERTTAMSVELDRGSS
jgi:hypothetical protein